jgi:hypothetical protein
MARSKSIKTKEIVGRRFGSIVVLAQDGTMYGGAHRRMKCLCQCGRSFHASANNLLRGRQQSCGCLCYRGGKKQSHPEYSVWENMKQRCRNRNSPHWHNYGGRGVAVCERWSQSFWNFLTDMGQRPTGLHTLERIDNDGDYEPNNCRWATRKEQQRNRRANHLISYNGRLLCMAELAELFGCEVSALRSRIRRGQDFGSLNQYSTP